MLHTRGGKRLLERFGDREDLGVEPAISSMWSHVPRASLDELITLIHTEFGIPFGLLRPDDQVARLVAPLRVGNPLTWVWAEAALEDAASELNHRLATRRPDLRGNLGSIQTLRDLVQVWCEPAT